MSSRGSSSDVLHTKIWHEEAQTDDPFSASKCRCHGYDVYGDLLGKASWTEYMFLLFVGEPPSPQQVQLLDGLAVAISHPGIRDHSIRAAMNGGVGGSPGAACLMAALAVGAGGLAGAHEVAAAMDLWSVCGTDLDAWKARLKDHSTARTADIWPPLNHPPGFNPHGKSCPEPVLATLRHLARCSPGSALPWLEDKRTELEQTAVGPLSMAGVAAAAFCDLGMDTDQGEMLFLIMRLPGAAIHAIEQRDSGWKRYPFFRNGLHLKNDPRSPEHAG